MCADLPYNETIFPNLMGQLTQDIAGQHMSQYVPLIKGRPGSNIKLPTIAKNSSKIALSRLSPNIFMNYIFYIMTHVMRQLEAIRSHLKQ